MIVAAPGLADAAATGAAPDVMIEAPEAEAVALRAVAVEDPTIEAEAEAEARAETEGAAGGPTDVSPKSSCPRLT